MKQDSGLSEQTKLCISRRYYRVHVHEFGDLRGRDSQSILQSIGPRVTNYELPKLGQAAAVFCEGEERPVMVGVLVTDVNLLAPLSNTDKAVASCIVLDADLKYPQFMDLTF